MRSRASRAGRRAIHGADAEEAIQDELAAVDDRTFKWVLKQPYPKMLLAFAKNNSPCSFVMPERIAKTDPFKQITEYVGSGPMRFVKDEWVPGAKAVFAKFADYVPRQEPASWLAGGKKNPSRPRRMDRHAGSGDRFGRLQNGEVDWWENPISDLVPLLRKNANIRGRYRRSARQYRLVPHEPSLPALQQCEGAPRHPHGLEPGRLHARTRRLDEKLWRPVPGYFTPGTPLYNEEGGDILKGKRDLDGAKRLLAEAVTRASRSPAWWRRTSRSPKRRAM